MTEIHSYQVIGALDMLCEPMNGLPAPHTIHILKPLSCTYFNIKGDDLIAGDKRGFIQASLKVWGMTHPGCLRMYRHKLSRRETYITET